MTIVEFLRARLDEEESAKPRTQNPLILTARASSRRYVAEHGDGVLDGQWCPKCETMLHPCYPLRLIAATYHDHPDYDAERWAP
ncbi:DUF6221 family protein [Streptomonospora wellingtoniae]|uniref:Uncharacterized protein n=1 Tax=Streptomonospora wellingtoniae TaxID=3075544 RepID=A0ABU2KUL3_9ACTN|nr:DUF6221 family protein [Streptomonospora sp. DSM 45055]MDT0302876.1 hypothetical protein [Streptomonospora sp. DSM 45055]